MQRSVVEHMIDLLTISYEKTKYTRDRIARIFLKRSSIMIKSKMKKVRSYLEKTL